MSSTQKKLLISYMRPVTPRNSCRVLKFNPKMKAVARKQGRVGAAPASVSESEERKQDPLQHGPACAEPRILQLWVRKLSAHGEMPLRSSGGSLPA